MRRESLHQPLPRIRHPITGRRASWLTGLLLWLCLGWHGAGLAQSVELRQLQLERRDGELVLEFSTRLTLGASIEDALQRGVPMYFNARATLYRDRWYWRDERIARVSRTWRLAYQPLTASWRLSLGGLSQSHASLSEALAPLTRVSGWRLVELDKLEPGERYHVEFSFGLDNSQLPQPMQIDLGGGWKLGIERSLKLE